MLTVQTNKNASRDLSHHTIFPFRRKGLSSILTQNQLEDPRALTRHGITAHVRPRIFGSQQLVSRKEHEFGMLYVNRGREIVVYGCVPSNYAG